MRETEISIRSGEVTLAGALRLAANAGPCPVVLCIHGTGPMDRDENMPGQRLDIFNAVAAHLAANNVATLRYDKRGCGRSTGDYVTAGQTELLADAVACFAHLEADARFTKRFALGHSEGTLLAARLALIKPVDGLALLNPFVQNLEAILVAQAREFDRSLRSTPGLAGLLNRLAMGISGGPIAGQRKVIRRLRQGHEATFRHGTEQVPAKSLREWMAVEPASIYAQLRCPALVLGGAKDLQCDPADVAGIATIMGTLATPLLMPDLTHILRRDAGEHSFRSYAGLIGQPMDAGVLEAVSAWLTSRCERN